MGQANIAQGPLIRGGGRGRRHRAHRALAVGACGARIMAGLAERFTQPPGHIRGKAAKRPRGRF